MAMVAFVAIYLYPNNKLKTMKHLIKRKLRNSKFFILRMKTEIVLIIALLVFFALAIKTNNYLQNKIKNRYEIRANYSAN
jgi:hypothetical protein